MKLFVLKLIYFNYSRCLLKIVKISSLFFFYLKNESFINYVLLFGFYKIKCYLYFFN